MISQWTWNLRLELGHQLKPQPLRTTEFAPAIPKPRELGAAHPSTSAPTAGFGPPVTATRLGKQVASLAQTFLSNLTAPSGVQPGGRWFPMSGVEKVVGACVWCMRPAFAVVGLVPCASSANGKAVPPRSHAR